MKRQDLKTKRSKRKADPKADPIFKTATLRKQDGTVKIRYGLMDKVGGCDSIAENKAPAKGGVLHVD